MKISEYMAKVNAATATGEYVGRDMVLSLDCSTGESAATKPGDYTYVGVHVEDYSAKLSAKTEDKSYNEQWAAQQDYDAAMEANAEAIAGVQTATDNLTKSQNDLEQVQKAVQDYWDK